MTLPLLPSDWRIALTLILVLWLVTGVFRRRRLPRLLGWVTLGWTLWHLRPAAQPRSTPTTLGVAALGLLAAWLATRAGRPRRTMLRRG